MKRRHHKYMHSGIRNRTTCTSDPGSSDLSSRLFILLLNIRERDRLFMLQSHSLSSSSWIKRPVGRRKPSSLFSPLHSDRSWIPEEGREDKLKRYLNGRPRPGPHHGEERWRFKFVVAGGTWRGAQRVVTTLPCEPFFTISVLLRDVAISPVQLPLESVHCKV